MEKAVGSDGHLLGYASSKEVVLQYSSSPFSYTMEKITSLLTGGILQKLMHMTNDFLFWPAQI